MKALCQTRKISSPARRTFLKPPEGRQIPELHLRLLEHILKRVAFLAPWVFGIPNHKKYPIEENYDGSLSAPP